MRYIEIAALDNGAHRNQTVSGKWRKIPEGWALIPATLETPNFPFGVVTAEEIDGVMTITKWEPSPIPEPEEPPQPYTPDDPEPTTEEILDTLLGVTV